MTITSSSCSSKSVLCTSTINANVNDTITTGQEIQNSDRNFQLSSQDLSTNLEKTSNVKALKSEVWKDFDRQVLLEDGITRIKDSSIGAPTKRTKLDLEWISYVEQKVGSSHGLKTELDRYLEDKLFPMGEDEDKFDILVWWKTNSPTFPILAKVAHDILAVSVSSVAYESAFSSCGSLITEGISSLSSDIVEALSCIKDWLPNKFGNNVELVDNASVAL